MADRAWGRRLVLGAIAMWCALAVIFIAPAAADDCGSPEDCEDTGGYNGIIGVVGGGAAVGAAAAAAAAAAAGADGIQGTEDDEEIDLSILQVSQNELFVDSENPAQLTLTGWHVGPDGQYRQVPMELEVRVPLGTGLTATPARGVGQLVVELALTDEPTEERVRVEAVGTHKGRTHVEIVVVELGDDLELYLE